MIAGMKHATRTWRGAAALGVLFFLASVDIAAAKKATRGGVVTDVCPSEFDDVECESYKRGVADGEADISVGVPDPFRSQLKDVGQFPYIRGYEKGRRKAGGA